MNESADVGEWHLPINNWSYWECEKFAKWMAEAYAGEIMGTMEEVLTGYRAVRDVEDSVATVTYKTTERYATGWTDARGVFGK